MNGGRRFAAAPSEEPTSMRNATAIAAVTGILLAGCQSSMVSRTNIEPFFHPTMVGYVTAKHGHMPVAVYGTPFGTDKATSDAAVASAMRMPGSFQAAEFKAMAKEANKLGLKLMVDLVVSHCAFDSELTKEHPKWFKHEHGSTGQRPFFEKFSRGQ